MPTELLEVAYRDGPAFVLLLSMWWDLRRTVRKHGTRITKLENITGASAGSRNVGTETSPGAAA